MRPTDLNATLPHPKAEFTLKETCRASCLRVLEQLTRIKETLLAEFAEGFEAHRHLLHLALNEAESLAWQTTYPHLVFPDLATEKVQAILDWEKHQASVRRSSVISSHVS